MRTAAVAMPPSRKTVWKQPATFVSLAQLGVREELFQRVASSQELVVKAGVRLDEIGFVLADKEQVEDSGFEPSVSLFVNATGRNTADFHYKGGRPMVRVSVLYEASRDASLVKALPAVMRAFSQGNRVCVHCVRSFHRGPVLYAALCRALFGLNAMVAMQTLGRTRTIWWEHLIPRCTGSELSQALQWAGRLNCWLPVVASSQVGAAGSTPQAKPKWAASSPAGAAGSSWQAGPKLVAASKVKGQGVASSQERRYVYRAMTRDLSEFNERRLPTWRGE